MKIFTSGVNLMATQKIKKIFKIAMKELGGGENLSVSISFVGEEEIKRLNKENRQVDKVTDVLSFPMLELKPGQDLHNLKDELFEEIFLGDIIICTKRAKEQAKEYGHSYSREISFLALHGLLHLLGYDHIEKEDEKIMMPLAEKILQKAGEGR